MTDQVTSKSAAHILHNTQRMIYKHIKRDTNKVNAQDEDGNTALHLIVKYYLEANQRHPAPPFKLVSIHSPA